MYSIILNSCCLIMIIVNMIVNIKDQESSLFDVVCLSIYAVIKTIECIGHKLM